MFGEKGPSGGSFRLSSVVPAPVEGVFSWHERPGALERLTPPWEQLEVLQSPGGLREGAEALLRLRLGPLRLRWKARHTDYDPPAFFADEQVSGPFAFWRHEHRFDPAGPRATRMTDLIRYRLPGPAGMHQVLEPLVAARLKRTFQYRHETLRHDMACIGRYGGRPLRIAVTGSGGVIGSRLIPFLTTAGHQVARLVRRRPHPGRNEVFWDPYAGILDTDALGPVDAVIHLAGDPIGKGRWTEEKRTRMLESRTLPTRFLAERMASLERPPRVFLSASAIGVYGHRGDQVLVETDPPGRDFLSSICRRWEAEASAFSSAGRLVLLRIGIALTPRGGALAELLPVFRCGAGVVFGSGRQFWSWIHVDDVVGAIYHALWTESLHGPVNLTAPEPVRQEDFSCSLARLLRRPVGLRVPEAVLSGCMGDKGREILLAGTRVFPRRLLATGYRFRYPSLEGALAALLGRC
ncbi:hypothetical protein SAMN02745206_03124 [Desulfacinum infernum DSM 9756]|uniref:Uncharacterized protein n=1 Tax=Desulfacinum infernum DSM 9756 TaxID=1121391 RepID=A0A1M5GFW7_9BACT|nr:TIGR01777 family oxidoreductase [Desulfacinum infernum]SHG02613.1 hypothetical protein SAMN02745206_03124 [Desulfacinum infernum DSM 9756]